MMLSARVAQPLASLAKLMEDIGEVRTATALAASVLNQRPESADPSAWHPPPFPGRNLVQQGFTTATPVPPRTPRFRTGSASASGREPSWAWSGAAGLANPRSPGCCKASPATTTGLVCIDGIDLRDINLAHLRRNLGVVLQENFLFRGTISENILAGRPGLTLSDAIHAARLAGAAEFIERLPERV